MKTVIISLGGSLIVPKKIDVSFLKKFKETIDQFADKGNRVVIVTGGGFVAREYISASERVCQVSDITKDYIGIRATKLNAELVLSMFLDKAYPGVVEDPTMPVETEKKVIVASGWKPGFSSDMDAVFLAENLKVPTVVNMSNIDFVYDKDPKQFPDASKIEQISWKDFLEKFNYDWKPGLNLPFDPVAAKKAAELKLKVIVIGKNIPNLKKLLEDKKFKGTVIS